MSEFCFIKHFCAHCGQEILLDSNRLAQYERRGYPQYIQGHQHFGENNVMKRPEVKAKIIGRKRPDFSAWLRTSKNPNFTRKQKKEQLLRLQQLSIEKQEEAEIKAKKDAIDKEYEERLKNGEEKRIRFLPNFKKIEKQVYNIVLPLGEPVVEIPKPTPENPEIKPIPYEKQLEIALARVKINRENNLKEKKLEPILPEAEEDNAYADRIKQLVGKFGDPNEKPKKYLKPIWNVKKKVK